MLFLYATSPFVETSGKLFPFLTTSTPMVFPSTSKQISTLYLFSVLELIYSVAFNVALSSSESESKKEYFAVKSTLDGILYFVSKSVILYFSARAKLLLKSVIVPDSDNDNSIFFKANNSPVVTLSDKLYLFLIVASDSNILFLRLLIISTLSNGSNFGFSINSVSEGISIISV